jgi:hypothetical protein
MRRTCLSTVTLFTFSAGTPFAFADGGYFFKAVEEGELAQTRQEVLLAFQGDDTGETEYVTYVLRTHYAGNPSEFAWVIPVPATPTDVVSHETAILFDELNELTKPRFFVFQGVGFPGGCGCGGLASDMSGSAVPGVVEVEAAGRAGIFEWVALTSTGSDALLDWLNDNGYGVPAEANDILDGYIQDGMHFLALRVGEPDQVENEGDVEIPPIQFTCQTSQRFYPMAISQISAADETEVLIYILADHRAEAANVSNALVFRQGITYDPATYTSNYVSMFDQALATWDGVVLVTESAYPVSEGWLSSIWPQAPDVLDSRFLTRMRTIIARDQMELDFVFQDTADDAEISSKFSIGAWANKSSLSVAAPPLMVLALYGVIRRITRRQTGRGH